MALLIRNGTVVNADQTLKADVLCDGGKIVALGADLPVPADAEVIDAEGQYVMPGGIDPHTVITSYSIHYTKLYDCCGLGMTKSMIIVVPPAAAARVPVKKSSVVTVPMNGT